MIWVAALQLSPSVHLPVSHPEFSQAVASLHVDESQTHSTWRSVLSLCSHSLKHLSLSILHQHLGEQLLPLQLPNLEILELWEEGWGFPTWMLVPSTLKLFTDSIYLDSPAIRELWTESLWNSEDFTSRCLSLQVLRVELMEGSQGFLLDLLRARRANVDSRLEVGVSKMMDLKKLVLSFDEYPADMLEEYRKLVGEVVNWDSEPRFWEVEI